MTPGRAITMLDRQLSKHGQAATFIREADDAPAVMVPVRVHIRGYSAKETGGGINQGDSAVTISPTDWTKTGIAGLPERLDRIRVSGRERVIENVDPVYLADALVRLDLQVRG